MNPEEKAEISVIAEKYNMNISEYVHQAVREKMQTNKLNDSQSQFLNLFDVAFKKSFEPFFKQLMVVQNKIEFDSRWLLKQQDIFMQHLKIPQTKEELNVSIIPHPITEIAEELVLKDIRKMSSHKRELDDE